MSDGLPATETPVTDETLARLATRHGVVVRWPVPRPWLGATSRVFDLGDVVVKVPHDESAAIASLRTDVMVSPIALNLGVRVAAIVAVEDDNDLLPVPYAIFERAPGAPLGETERRSMKASRYWEAVGRQLAIIHVIPESDAPDVLLGLLRRFRQTAEVDPRPWATELADAGMISSTDEVRWRCLLERLAVHALEPIPLRLCHGDVNAENVLIDPNNLDVVTLIDWAGAGWMDPVWDLAALPLGAVPHLLHGHRSVSPLPNDETAETRILWCRLQIALNNARRTPERDTSTRSRLAHSLAESRAFSAKIGLG